MARLIAFVGLVALGVAGALFIITERAAVTDAGYRVARIEADRRKLVEANRKLEAQVASLKTPSVLAERVKGLQLDLMPPDQSLEQQLAKEKEEAKAKAKAGDPAPRARKGR